MSNEPNYAKLIEKLIQDWPDTYRAFSGAFDTPLSRRRQDDEYSNDARRRLQQLNELVERITGHIEAIDETPKSFAELFEQIKTDDMRPLEHIISIHRKGKRL